MAFVTKTWKDRLVEYAGRRKLKNVATGEEILMDVSRSEGTVNQAGDAFSATNMNDLEQRIKTEFDSVNSSLGGLSFTQDEKGNWGYKPSGADTVIPFKSGIKAQSFSVNVARGQSKTVKCNGGDILYVAISSYNYYYSGSESFTATVSVSISGNIATIRNNCDGGVTDSTITGNLLYAG